MTYNYESMGPLKRAASIPKVEIPKEKYASLQEATKFCGSCSKHLPLRHFVFGTKASPRRSERCRACREGAPA